jgi:hypothetical protein
MIPLDPESIRQFLLRRRISTWTIARRLEIDNSHLTRVLAGKRPGSRALLQSVVDIAQGLASRRRSQDDLDRLISAAAHVFFLKRGAFQSDIFDEPRGEGTKHWK